MANANVPIKDTKQVIFEDYESVTSYAIQTQRHGRLERADSVHNSVIVYQLIANDSWDEIQQKIVSKK